MLVALALCLRSVPGLADEAMLECEGPEGPYKVPATVSCSEIPSAEDAAERFLDALLRESGDQAPDSLAAALEAEASQVCGPRPEKGTVGELLGVDRWGCAAGYARRNLCQGYVLEKTESLDR